ncbi:MAG: lysostaphin resistance A-like protein [Terriglobales bacterium]
MNLWIDEDGKLRLAWRIVLAIVLTILVNLLALGIAEAAGRSERSVDFVYRPTAALLLIAVYSAMLLFADRVHGNPLTALGLGRLHRGRLALGGMALGALMVGFAVAGTAVAGTVHWTVHFNGDAVGLIAVELFILMTGAMTEELMFRGYPFQRLVEAAGSTVAVVLMSALFGLAHLGNPHSSFWAVTNTILVGVLLSLAYLRTRSLWLPWGIHFGWNFALGLGFGLPVSGLTEFAVAVHGYSTGPIWLTGGAYGVEGGALGTGAILLGFIPLVWFTRRVATIETGSGAESPSGAPAASK